MPYAAPALSDLRTAVLRDLRDPTGGTFSPEQVADFINGGIADLNDTKPLERYEELTFEDGLSGLAFNYIFRVESYVENPEGVTASWSPMPPEGGNMAYGRNGWTFFAGILHFPAAVLEAIERLATRYTPARVHFAIWGYGDRSPLLTDDEVAEFIDSNDEQYVRKFARLEGYRALNTDFALFQQWTALAQNSGVSPTQLLNDVGLFEAEVQRIRRRIYTIRRPQSG